MDAKKTGEFLQALRKSCGWTQEEVAEKLYLSSKTISRWESGAGLPDINIISAVAELYGVSVDEILRGERNSAARDDVTEQTKKLRAENKARLVEQQINKKHNVFFIVAASVLGGFMLLELILGVLASAMLSLLIGALGMIAALVIMLFGYSDVKAMIAAADDEALGEGIERARRNMRSKNMMFADIFAGVLLFSIVFFASLICPPYVFLQFLIFAAVETACYIMLRLALYSKIVKGQEVNIYATLMRAAVINAAYVFIFMFKIVMQEHFNDYPVPPVVITPERIYAAIFAEGVVRQGGMAAEYVSLFWFSPIIEMIFSGHEAASVVGFILCLALPIAELAVIIVAALKKNAPLVFIALAGAIVALIPFVTFSGFISDITLTFYADINPAAILACVVGVACAVTAVVYKKKTAKKLSVE